MQHLVWELGSYAGGAVFEVAFRGSNARVCLMDADNYQAYLDGEDYQYHGDFFDLTPVELVVPHDDYWYIIVDSNLDPINVTVTQMFD